MRQVKRILLGLVCIVLFPFSAWGIDIDYPNFSDLSAFTLGPKAQELNPNPDNKLKLISGTWQRGGYAYLSDPIDISAGYSTQFSFQITNLIDGGADWLWFIVQETPFETAGSFVIVEVDIYNNGARDNYNGNHLALGYDIGLEYPWVVIQPVSPSFKNGAVWNVWIDYDGSVMKIYASMDSVKPLTPYISHSINVPDKIGASEAYIGFWAASGADGADFDILQWSFSTPPPSLIPIDIDIKPGSFPNSINPKSEGKIPVALLSTEEFDALQMVNKDSLTFGRTGDEESLAFCNYRGEDVDGDGLKDLICHFFTEDTGFLCGDTEGVLKGMTTDGTPVEGSDSVKIIPCKKPPKK